MTDKQLPSSFSRVVIGSGNEATEVIIVGSPIRDEELTDKNGKPVRVKIVGTKDKPT